MRRRRGAPVWQLRTGKPVEVGEYTLTPVVRRLFLRRTRAGFVWQYPVAVLVEQEGEETRLPIPDPTRTLWYVLMAGTLLALVILAIIYASRRSLHETRSATLQGR